MGGRVSPPNIGNKSLAPKGKFRFEFLPSSPLSLLIIVAAPAVEGAAWRSTSEARGGRQRARPARSRSAPFNASRVRASGCVALAAAAQNGAEGGTATQIAAPADHVLGPWQNLTVQRSAGAGTGHYGGIETLGAWRDDDIAARLRNCRFSRGSAARAALDACGMHTSLADHCGFVFAVARLLRCRYSVGHVQKQPSPVPPRPPFACLTPRTATIFRYLGSMASSSAASAQIRAVSSE